MVGRRLLSELDEGAVTYFSYALRLCDFSQGIFIMALSTATLPSLATFVGKGDLEEVARTFAYSLRLALFVGAAATLLSVSLAYPLVATVFERGQFSHYDTQETASAFVAQGVGIFLVAGVRQLVIVFFALGKTSTPVYVAIVDLVVFAALGMGLREEFGHVGVSLAVTGARITQFTLLWLALRRHLPTLHGTEVARSFLKSTLAASAAGALAWLSIQNWPALLPSGSLRAASTASVGGAVFLVVFVLGARLFKSEELAATLTPLLRRLRRGR
jgi:putative peptidoglycan lipid II flippase